MIEQKIKTLIGEYAFQTCILQDQVEQLKEQLKEKNGQSNDPQPTALG